MTIGLAALVERYLTQRRQLGFQLRSPAYSLRSLAEHVRRTRHRGPLTLEVMAEWARQDSHRSIDPRTWARPLKHLRSFTRWLQQFEPATEVPDDTIFGRLPERTLRIPLTGPSMPDSLEAVELHVTVAGQKKLYVFGRAPDLSYVWFPS